MLKDVLCLSDFHPGMRCMLCMISIGCRTMHVPNCRSMMCWNVNYSVHQVFSLDARLQHRTGRSTEQGDAEDGVQTKHRSPIGLLQAAAIGTSVGIASTMFYMWCMERQRQDDLVWDYYRNH